MESQNKEFDETDKKLDEVRKNDSEHAKKGYKSGFDSNVELRNKTFMKISDVDREDADWFKKFADENFDKKQFLAIKFIRQIMERFDPLMDNVVKQINSMDVRISSIEASLNVPEEVDNEIHLPKTQGRNKK